MFFVKIEDREKKMNNTSHSIYYLSKHDFMVSITSCHVHLENDLKKLYFLISGKTWPELLPATANSYPAGDR